MTLGITTLCHYTECCCAECHILFIVMLNVIMLSVIMLNVIMLSVAMQNVIMLSVVAAFHAGVLLAIWSIQRCLTLRQKKLND